MKNEGTLAFCVVVRPPSLAGGDAVLSDACSGKKFAIPCDSLYYALEHVFTSNKNQGDWLGLISDLGIAIGVEVDALTLEKMRVWWDRGWYPSLHYYLWSRHCVYLDEYDPASRVREQTLKDYLVSEPPPSRVAYSGSTIELPRPDPLPVEETLGQVLLRRRTVRKFSLNRVRRMALSTILWHGLNRLSSTRFQDDAQREPLELLKSYGVAVDFYLAIYNVEDIASGIYVYNYSHHSICLISEGDFRQDIRRLMWGQSAPLTGAWTIFLVLDFPQYQWRYRHERALRNLYIEIGRISQSLLLCAQALNCGSFPTPAFKDEETALLLKTNTYKQYPAYSITMGNLL
jgi:SagB-type dehydrogenase family enzyme